MSRLITVTDEEFELIVKRRQGRPQPQSFPEHEWVDTSRGLGGHNGEYTCSCRRCGKSDWVPYYGKMSDLKGPCIPKVKP